MQTTSWLQKQALQEGTSAFIFKGLSPTPSNCTTTGCSSLAYYTITQSSNRKLTMTHFMLLSVRAIILTHTGHVTGRLLLISEAIS
uniref:Uncharacterized protein n=1 Tax=Anguilla anguilla TaxID=7936 RepID=A0A0E9PBH8_ANGAN